MRGKPDKRVLAAIAAVAVAVGCGVAALLLLGDSDESRSPNSIGPEGGEVSALGVTIRVPPGAVRKETTFAIERAAASASTLVPEARDASPAFSITASGPLAKPVELHLPVSGSGADGRLLAATRERPTDMWALARGTFDRGNSALVIKTRDLSFWQVLKDAAFKKAVDLGVAATSGLLRAGGTRAREPECGSRPPGYSLSGATGIGDADATIFACLEARGEQVAVRLVNNRAIGLELEVPKGLQVDSRKGAEISDALLDAAARAFAGDEGNLRTIPATGELTLVGAPAEARLVVKPTLRSFVFDLGVFAISQAGGAPGAVADYLTCLGNAATRLHSGPPDSAQEALDAALGVWGDCGDTLARVGAKGLTVKAAAVFFGGMKLGTGIADAVRALVTKEAAEVRIEEVAVAAGTSCGSVTATGAAGEVAAELIVESGEMKCSFARRLWDRYWAAGPDEPCDRQGAGTCWRDIEDWTCVVPTAGAHPTVFTCSETSGGGELIGRAQGTSSDRACRSLPVTQEVRRGLLAAVRSRGEGAERRAMSYARGPVRGQTYYGSCGATRYARATFDAAPGTDDEVGVHYQDQPWMFRQETGGDWEYLGDTGGSTFCGGPIPTALLRAWKLDCD